MQDMQHDGVPMHDTCDNSMIADIRRFVLMSAANLHVTQMLTD